MTAVFYVKPMNQENMTTQEKSKKKSFRYLILLVIVGLAVNFILPKLMDINQAFQVLLNMTWWLVFAAAFAEALVYISYGFSMKSILDIQGHNLSIFQTALIFLSSYSVGTVAGGWIGSAATSVSLFAKKGVKPVDSTVAGLLPSMLTNIPLSVLGIIGMISLAVNNGLSQSRLIQYSVFIGLLLLISLAPLIGLAFPKAAFKLVNWLLWNWNRFRKKPYEPQNTQDKLDDFFNAWRLMGKGNWWAPLLGVTGYYLFDMLTMGLIFRAAGYPIKLAVLIAGYALPYILAKVTFIIPGGIGVIETAMAGFFVSQAVPDDIALVVVLGYRLISFWIPILLGFLGYFLLNRSKDSGKEKPTPQDRV